MPRRTGHTIKAPGSERRRDRDEIAVGAPPQREPTDLKYSHDLGGVVDPHDDDLFDDGGWRSWSAGERLAVVAAVIVLAALLAAVVVALVG